MSSEFVAHFNRTMSGITNMPAKLREALRNYVFCGNPDPDNKLEEEYLEMVLAYTAGEPLDDSLLIDGNSKNSRGGKGLGETMFEDFYDACDEVLMPSAATDERRVGDVMHASGACSVADLRRQAVAILEAKVKDGKLDEMPPIPADEWIRLQFVPNVRDSELASTFTGRLKVTRTVQTRTLSKEHMDQVSEQEVVGCLCSLF